MTGFAYQSSSGCKNPVYEMSFLLKLLPFLEYAVAGKKYTKADIIDSVSQKTELNRRDVRDVLDLLIDEIKNSLTNGLVLELRGFGTFEVKVRQGRKRARNPKTGTPVSVESHGVAIFRPGKDLKHAVWALVDAPSGD